MARFPIGVPLVLCLLVLCLLASVASAQQDGVPPFSVAERYEVDAIDLVTLNPTLNIPVVSKIGAIPFSYKETAQQSCTQTYYSPYAQSDHVSCQITFAGYTNTMVGMHVTATQQGTVWCQGSSGLGWYVYYTSFLLLSSDSLDQHVINGSLYSCGGPTSFNSVTIDGSGYTVNASLNTTTGVITYTITSASGHVSSPPASTQTETDPFGNTIVGSGLGGAFSYTDSLGIATAYYALVNGNTSFAWPDTNGNQQAISLVRGASSALSTNWPCTYQQPAGPIAPTSITYPDGTAIGMTMELGVNGAGTTTGRIGSITTRTGAQISYAYGPLSAVCYSNLPAYASWLTRTTPDGTTTYTKSGGGWPAPVTTVVDPGGNKTIYTFSVAPAGYTGRATVLTQVQKYQNTGTVSNPVYSLLVTDSYCYNGNQTSCSTATVNYPITQKDVYHSLGGMSNSSRVTATFDSYENITSVAKYDFGASAYTTKTTTTYGSWNGSACVAVGNNIQNLPCDVLTWAGGHNISEKRYTYDSKGDLLTTYVWNGSAWLSNTTANSYNSNGTVATSYDLANNPTTYGYSPSSYVGCGSCTNYPFPTSISKGGLTTYSTWNAWGGVKLSDTDANGNTTTYGYTSCVGGAVEPFWRVTSVTDPLGNEVCKTYPSGSSPDTSNSNFSFNSGGSVQNTTTTTDGYGRATNVQTQQGPASSSYDTVSTVYGWSGGYRTVATSLPCSQQLDNSCSTVHTNYYDMEGRLSQGVTNNNETQTNTFTKNDALSVLSPAPANENNKQVQKQYDGLGRLQYSCAIGNGSATPCGQNTGSANGVTTSFSYTYASGSSTTTQTRGSQSRSKTYDAIGRVIQSVTPEGGTWYDYYDSYSACPNGYGGAKGQLAAVKDPNGNLLCYAYDSLNRVIGVNAHGTTCRHFYYDNSTGYSGSIPSGVSTPLDPYGRMVEAATDSCTGGSLITDEWFSYDKDGHMTDMWEKTPHSTQYYHSNATFYGNGVVNVLTLSSPLLFNSTYALDGEGRWNQMTTYSQTIVPSQGVTFNAAGQPTLIDIGTGADNDAYTYDANTGRMKTWKFTVGTKNESATLNWNANGTLNNLAITDGFNSGGTQTCYFSPSSGSGMGYDDWGRLLNDNCGSIWAQTFSYDQYDNLTKSGSITWNPGYNPANNHYALAGTSYDSNGHLLNDTIHQYTWNEFSKVKSVDSSACGTNGECITYDALGRAVEISNGSAYTEIWYTQLGKTAYMNGNTFSYAYWPTPGRGTLLQSAGYTYYFGHKDWLGSARISSDLGNTIIDDRAFAPYGEMYQNFGSTSPNELIFTGDTQDVATGIYDTPNRELNASQGRWISPDPAGQGWNQYAYPSDPLSAVDPSGLFSYSLGDLHGCNAFAFCSDPTPLWDEFDILHLAFTPTSYKQQGWILQAVPGIPDKFTPWSDGYYYYNEVPNMVPVYGNLGLLALLGLGPGQTPQTPQGPTPPPQNQNSQTKQQKCQQAKANYAAIESQGKAMRNALIKETVAGIGVGCVTGIVGGEALETPAIGTPAALGNCAVGAIAVGGTTVGIFGIANFGDLVSGSIAEVKAVAQMAENCL
jgi:RHS repeat-associated protein